jgi:hypothetical protein
LFSVVADLYVSVYYGLGVSHFTVQLFTSLDLLWVINHIGLQLYLAALVVYTSVDRPPCCRPTVASTFSSTGLLTLVFRLARE